MSVSDIFAIIFIFATIPPLIGLCGYLIIHYNIGRKKFMQGLTKEEQALIARFQNLW